MNHNHQLLQSLYVSASGKYLKYKERYDKAIHSGRFYKFNKRRQSSLISRLKRLYERLKSLQTQLRIAGASAAFALTLSISNPAQAQNLVGPFERNDDANPLPPPYFIESPRLAVVDIDGDGDIDIFAGTGNGDIEFFRNRGGPLGTVKRFTKITDSSNPLGEVNMGPHAAPAFIDVDGDLDFDMLLGTEYGNTFFFRNTGSATNPSFSEQTGSSNPFDGITGTSSKYGTLESIPVFVDTDGDGDLDLFIGSTYSSDIYGGHDAVQFFENSAGNFAPASHNLTGYLRYFSNTAMTFADIDGNGELDVLVSDGFGPLRFYVECGGGEFCEQIGPWDPIARTGNPMNSFYSYNGSPILADFDKDEALDLIVGQSNVYASAIYYENIDGAYTFENQNDLNISPLGGVNVGSQAAPTFVDLDNDGDLDAVIGAKYSDPDLYVYVNEDGEFFADPKHPLVEILEPFGFAYNVIPVFVDIDDDGDQDFFVWTGYQLRHFIYNQSDEIFEPAESSLNPSGDDVSIAFIDVDNDNDFDALVGSRKYGASGITYYRNNGNATTADFISETPPEPFNNSIFENYFNSVAAVDLDNDGDLDLAVSETYYTGIYDPKYASHTRYFENNKDGTFTESSSSPLIEVQSPAGTFIAFADIDNDGDLDGFLGNSEYGYSEIGQVTYFENTDPLNGGGNSLNVYNGFSPNTDDVVNSFFRIGNIERISPKNTVTIYNRWGDVVFEVKDYKNNDPEKRFEGVSNNGKDLPTGTYFYKIEITDQTVTGYLSLKR